MKDKYVFTGEVRQLVESFGNYLQNQHLRENTIRQKTNYAGYFLEWCENERLKPEDARYNDVLDFIDYCKLESMGKKHINTILLAIRNYYEFLKTTDENITNPANGLVLRGTRHKIPSGILSIETLEKLYQNYPATTTRTKRNKIILGLLIYQGITTEELHRLEPIHLKLKEGKIYIPGNRKRNSRTLELKPFQIFELQEYLIQTRTKIIEEITKPKPARKPFKIDIRQIERQLFISINGSENIKNSLLHLFKSIRKINPEVKNAKQIRQGVITNWLKHYNLRQVQYMAGHRFVSSTERYQVNNLENLQKQVEKYHPLNKF